MEVPEWLDLSAVVVGALAGVLVAQEHKLDLVGFVAMCLICALGGGILRDVIMQVGDVYALRSLWAIPLCVVTALVGFMFPTMVAKHPNMYEWVDMISVGLFVVAGTSKAVAYGLHVSATILMGTITGVGGGMLRDVFLGEVPQVFRRSNLYALCAVAGAFAFWLCTLVDGVSDFAPVVTVAVVVLLRRLSLRYDIMSPAEVDLGPQVAQMREKISRKRKG